MRMQELNGARKVSAADRKALAIMAFERALELGDMANNWREVAELLREALPAPRVAGEAADDRWLPWSDRAVGSTPSAWRKLGWPSPRITVAFADGEVINCQCATSAGEPVNIGRGIRVAIAFYRAKMFNRLARAADETWGRDDSYVYGRLGPNFSAEDIAVPDIVSVTPRDDDGAWDHERATAQTAALRAGTIAPIARPSEACAAPAPTERQIAARAIYRKALHSTAIIYRRAA